MNTNYWKPSETNSIDMVEWCDKIIENRMKYTNTRIIGFVLSKLKQQKKEPVIRVDLLNIDPAEIEIHHKKPKSKGGTDNFNNLVILHRRVHIALHANHQCEVNWNKSNYGKLLKQIWEN